MFMRSFSSPNQKKKENVRIQSATHHHHHIRSLFRCLLHSLTHFGHHTSIVPQRIVPRDRSDSSELQMSSFSRNQGLLRVLLLEQIHSPETIASSSSHNVLCTRHLLHHSQRFLIHG